jgi:hypothetical protein
LEDLVIHPEPGSALDADKRDKLEKRLEKQAKTKAKVLEKQKDKMEKSIEKRQEKLDRELDALDGKIRPDPGKSGK